MTSSPYVFLTISCLVLHGYSLRQNTDMEVSTPTGVCSVTEAGDEDVVSYGITMSYDIYSTNGCSRVSCNVHKFMNNKLLPGDEAGIIKASIVYPDDDDWYPGDDGASCLCLAGKTPLFHMPGASCSPSECWNRFSVVMAISKRDTKKGFKPPDYLDSFNHWTASCADGPSPMVVPRLSTVVADLEADGKDKEAAAIRKVVDVDELDNVPDAPQVFVEPLQDDKEIQEARDDDDEADFEEVADNDPAQKPNACEDKQDSDTCRTYAKLIFLQGSGRCHQIPNFKFVKTCCCFADVATMEAAKQAAKDAK